MENVILGRKRDDWECVVCGAKETGVGGRDGGPPWKLHASWSNSGYMCDEHYVADRVAHVKPVVTLERVEQGGDVLWVAYAVSDPKAVLGEWVWIAADTPQRAAGLAVDLVVRGMVNPADSADPWGRDWKNAEEGMSREDAITRWVAYYGKDAREAEAAFRREVGLDPKEPS